MRETRLFFEVSLFIKAQCYLQCQRFRSDTPKALRMLTDDRELHWDARRTAQVTPCSRGEQQVKLREVSVAPVCQACAAESLL